ncbi:hypothetical protein COV61_04470 [Candidatus Micrarchaeota archaeon CG11_big_fil_rev_8_21_14_0_20_47_5]|nr:MAG: hypothetical protein AUJ17_05295 [Candidatus Micrarchaeota archaeon CG1_02_47_40]PIN82979.1 MAG: hypothetical protein COV61_04470 [Candidatus Micrarchaeota archaeon CG11_big_fil_rev_8_21_14_0_20_47_5]
MNRIYARKVTLPDGRSAVAISGKRAPGSQKVKKGEFFHELTKREKDEKNWNLTEKEAETIRFAEKIGKKYDLRITSPEVGIFRVEFPKESGISSQKMNPKELAGYLKQLEFLFLKAMANERGYNLKEDPDGNRYIVFEGEKAIMSLRPADVEKFLQRMEMTAQERKKAGIE